MRSIRAVFAQMRALEEWGDSHRRVAPPSGEAAERLLRGDVVIRDRRLQGTHAGVHGLVVDQIIEHPAGKTEPAEVLVDSHLPDEQARGVSGPTVADHEPGRAPIDQRDAAGVSEITGVQNIRV